MLRLLTPEDPLEVDNPIGPEFLAAADALDVKRNELGELEPDTDDADPDANEVAGIPAQNDAIAAQAAAGFPPGMAATFAQSEAELVVYEAELFGPSIIAIVQPAAPEGNIFQQMVDENGGTGGGDGTGGTGGEGGDDENGDDDEEDGGDDIPEN